MSSVGMYYVGGIFNLIFLVLSFIGYFYINRKTGTAFMFWLLFAAAWLLSFISYIFLIFGAASDAVFITVIRIFTYIFFLATIISMFMELKRKK